jgi:hypothetical protein
MPRNIARLPVESPAVADELNTSKEDESGDENANVTIEEVPSNDVIVASLQASVSGKELRENITEHLPQTREKGGRSYAFQRILKVLVEENALPSDFGKSVSSLSKPKIKQFFEVFDAQEEATILEKMKCAACAPFVNVAKNTAPSSTSGGTGPSSGGSAHGFVVINKVAFFAHIITLEDATPILDEIRKKLTNDERKVALDSNPQARLLALWQQLLDLGNANKHLMVNEAADLVQGFKKEVDIAGWLAPIQPSCGSVGSAAELRKMYTTYCNLFTTIETNIDASGSNYSGLLRQEKAFHFCGRGANIDLGLYYLFLLWSTIPDRLQWCNARLPDEVKSPSATSGKKAVASSAERYAGIVSAIKSAGLGGVAQEESPETKMRAKKMKTVHDISAMINQGGELVDEAIKARAKVFVNNQLSNILDDCESKM